MVYSLVSNTSGSQISTIFTDSISVAPM